MKVLIIDDEEVKIKIYIKKFSQFDDNIQYFLNSTVKEALETLEKDKSFDSILLDIQDLDMQAEDAYDRIKKLVPYIPIIMLSKQRTAEGIIEFIDRGAKSYILKTRLDISVDSSYLSASSKKALEARWKNCVEKIKRFSEEYQPIKRKLYERKEIGWITKRGKVDKSIIKDQIEFLNNIKFKSGIKSYFPEISQHGQINNEQGWWQYVMPYYNLKSLKNKIFNFKNFEDYEKNMIKKAISEILKIVFEKLYTHDISKVDNEGNFLSDTYFTKFSRRYQEIFEIIKSLKSGTGKILLEKLLNVEKIIIEGKEFINPKLIINELQSDVEFTQLMIPPKICLIHGDLHFDNILVDLAFSENIKILFIDPRGFRTPQDIAYDIGKLLHSVHGEYDFIHDGYLKTTENIYIDEHGKKIICEPLSFYIWADKQINEGGSRDIITTHESMVTEIHRALYKELERFIINEIESKGYLEDDDNWKVRSYFNEAMHFCTMLPFHVEKDIIRTISIYLRGVELINEFYNNYIVKQTS